MNFHKFLKLTEEIQFNYLERFQSQHMFIEYSAKYFVSQFPQNFHIFSAKFCKALVEQVIPLIGAL